MKKQTLTHVWVVLASIALSFSCGQPKSSKAKQKSLSVPSIISAYTSGIISSESKVRVVFSEDMVDSTNVNVPLEKPLLKFTPNIKGVTLWSNRRTLEFRPQNKLEQGQNYKVTLATSQISPLTIKYTDFNFSFTVIKQALELNIEGFEAVKTKDLKWLQLKGYVNTADAADGIEIEKIIKAKQKGKELSVTWMHSEGRTKHEFIVNNVERYEDSTELHLVWDGSAIGVSDKGEQRIGVPPLNSFSVIQATVNKTGDEQFIELRFSEPLNKSQYLGGLITVTPKCNLKFSIYNNIIKVYLSNNYVSGSLVVTVEKGIRNIMDQKLKNRAEFNLVIEDIRPQIRFGSSGVIVPTTQGVIVPIEAVNLKSIKVEAFQIFDNNITQFLQINNLDGFSELKRVGRVVWRKNVPLQLKTNDRNTWIRRGLDLSPLLEKFPGGMYSLTVSFSRNDVSAYCEEIPDSDKVNDLQENEDIINLDEEKESSYWDSYEEDEYYVNDWDEYYANRDNPCHDAFYSRYNKEKYSLTRNILISNIGLIAKRGTSDTMIIIANDIRSCEPMANVKVSLLDYHQQTLTTGETNNNGIAALYCPKTPFLLIANHEKQQGFLKLDNGNALSVSQFDVAGQTIQKGLKGFLYGERGVWRPGDSLYLTFILQDPDKRLPQNYPVSFELYNSRNQLVTTLRRNLSLNGFYNFNTSTSPDAPTGEWRAVVKAGGATFEKMLKIETVMPNRLKIKIDFDADFIVAEDGPIVGKLSASWLHGARANNLKADVKVNFNQAKTSFPKFEAYIFDDPVRTYTPESQELFEGILDDAGETTFEADINIDDVSAGMLMANFQTRVFEPSGAFSIDRFSVPYHPYSRYVGIAVPKGDVARGMLLTDTTHIVNIVGVDYKGKLLSSGQVEVKLYKLRWRWWWEKDAEDNLADYIGSSGTTPLMSDTVNLVGGKTSWGFKIKYPDWGRYLIRVRDLNSNHCSGKIVYVDWPGWAGRAQKDMPGGATVLIFSADKEEYMTGEKVVLTIPTPPKSRGLITLETGTKVIFADWFSSSGTSTRYEFTATADMSPNIYAHVTLLQPHLKTENDLPLRMYGVIPIKIKKPNTELFPIIAANEVFTPESKAEIKISEKNGKAMTYTLAVVDEGLLDLTRFATPNPWDYFYKREALGVKTWDVYDMVAGAYGATLERFISIGGGDDEGSQQLASKKANRFPPMVRFIGPFYLDQKKTNTHIIDIPQYIGSVRIMVVAGHNQAYGAAEKTAFVRKPLMVLGTLPRVLSIKEETKLPISVFAFDNIKTVKVSVEAKGAIAIKGETNKKIAFSEPDDQLVYFDCVCGEKPGVGVVTINASSGTEKATHTIEIDVRNPTQPVVEVVEKAIAPQQNWNEAIALPGIAGTNKVLLEVSYIPPLNLGKRLQYLIQYPHGCVEQTVSSVFPQLYLNKLLDLSSDTKKEIEKNIKAGIDRLRQFQTSDGGFAYWPSQSSDEWTSNYAGHFLVESQRIGYAIPAGMIEQWKKFQSNRSRTWTSQLEKSQLMQAYRLYSLALSGEYELGAMNRLKEEKNLEAAALWVLATAYLIAGQQEAAQTLIRNAPLSFKPYRELSYTYGSDLRDKAMVLEALCRMNKIEEAKKIAEQISKELCSNKWLSTQTTAYALIGMATFAGLTAGSNKSQFSYTWNNAKENNVSFTTPLVQLPIEIHSNQTSGTIEVKNSGSGYIFTRLILEGLPQIGSEKSYSNGMSINVKYIINNENDIINEESIEQGRDFYSIITVKNTSNSEDYKEVALSFLVPSGWEIHNNRMASGSSKVKSSVFEYQDIRDDRIYTYFDLNAGESKTFTFLLNAAYIGKFYLPMVSAEVMYDATINATNSGKWVTVVMPSSYN